MLLFDGNKIKMARKPGKSEHLLPRRFCRTFTSCLRSISYLHYFTYTFPIHLFISCLHSISYLHYFTYTFPFYLFTSCLRSITPSNIHYFTYAFPFYFFTSIIYLHRMQLLWNLNLFSPQHPCISYLNA